MKSSFQRKLLPPGITSASLNKEQLFGQLHSTRLAERQEEEPKVTATTTAHFWNAAWETGDTYETEYNQHLWEQFTWTADGQSCGTFHYKHNQGDQRSEFPVHHGMPHNRRCMPDAQEWKAGLRCARMLEIPVQIRHEHCHWRQRTKYDTHHHCRKQNANKPWNHRRFLTLFRLTLVQTCLNYSFG